MFIDVVIVNIYYLMCLLCLCIVRVFIKIEKYGYLIDNVLGRFFID